MKNDEIYSVHPALDFVGSLLERIDRSELIQSLNALGREREIALSFIPSPSQKLSAVEYETRIVHQRELIVNDNWHDIFNACIWLTFPKTKRTISDLHVSLGSGENNQRPRRRDVLTLFDESGMLMVSERSDFREMNEHHQWRKLFVEHRDEFVTQVKPILFGHGAMEQLVTQFHRGLTVKAMWIELSSETSLDALDDHLASQIQRDTLLTDNERRVPLPLLGVPGWFDENKSESCYDDLQVFRPLRKK